MSSRITVLIRNHPAGGVVIENAPKDRTEYFLQFAKAIDERLATLTVKDVDGDYFVFVPSEIQGFTIEGL